MSTDAQFKPQEIVMYTDGDMKDHPSVVAEVTEKNPAQYRVINLATGESTVCGEGVNEPGAIHAL